MDNARVREEGMSELLQGQRSQTRVLRVLLLVNALLLAILLAGAVILIPRTTAMMRNTEESLLKVEELTSQAKDSLDGIDEMVGNANRVLSENADGMNEAIGNFNHVDFESLNQTIQDLSDAVAPLAKLVRMFE